MNRESGRGMKGYESEMKNVGGWQGEGEGRGEGEGQERRGKRLVMREEVLGKREEAKSDRKWVREWRECKFSLNR